MRIRILIFLFLLFSLLSCSKDVLPQSDIVVKRSSIEGDIEDPAQEYGVMESMVKEYIGLRFPKNDVIDIKKQTKGQVVAYYIVSFEDGFAIVSGDKRLSPLVAYVKTGHFEDIEEDSPFLFLLDNYSSLVYHYAAIPDLEETEAYKMWEFLRDAKSYSIKDKASSDDTKLYGGEWWTKVFISMECVAYEGELSHLMCTRWGQTIEWCNACPYAPYRIFESEFFLHCPPGCGPVAAAQILYYWHFKSGQPSGLYEQIDPIYFTSDTNCIAALNGTYVEDSNLWEGMAKTNVDSHTDYASNFMVEVGYNFHAVYSLGGTGTFISDLPELLEHYNFSCTVSPLASQLKQTIDENLLNGYPVYIRGDRGVPGSGHAWVIDGYSLDYDQFIYTYQWEKGMKTDLGPNDQLWSDVNFYGGVTPIENEIVTEQFSIGSSMYQFNFGDNGRLSDGIYNSELLFGYNPNIGGYTNNLMAGYDIHPFEYGDL